MNVERYRRWVARENDLVEKYGRCVTHKNDSGIANLVRSSTIGALNAKLKEFYGSLKPGIRVLEELGYRIVDSGDTSHSRFVLFPVVWDNGRSGRTVMSKKLYVLGVEDADDSDYVSSFGFDKFPVQVFRKEQVQFV